MKAFSIVLVLVLLALIALTLQPVLEQVAPTLREAGAPVDAYLTYLPFVIFGVAIVLLLTILLNKHAAPQVPVARIEAVKPPPPPILKNQAESEVIGFLAALQSKGRLVDFLMDDITTYKDAQIGAVARVVHEGCKTVLEEHFTIRPVRDEQEGTAVTVPAGYFADEYRFIGNISGEAPFSGNLVHKGWKTEAVSLPRIIAPSGDRLPAIAPAEVELK